MEDPRDEGGAGAAGGVEAVASADLAELVAVEVLEQVGDGGARGGEQVLTEGIRGEAGAWGDVEDARDFDEAIAGSSASTLRSRAARG